MAEMAPVAVKPDGLVEVWRGSISLPVPDYQPGSCTQRRCSVTEGWRLKRSVLRQVGVRVTG